MITFFDLETTGTSTTKDRIVSFSAIQTDNNFVKVEGSEKSLLFNPGTGILIPKEASDVHGITNEMVAGKPTFKQYAPKILAYMYLSDYLGGYNISKFDIPLLFEEFFRSDGIIFDIERFKILDGCQVFHKKEPRDLTAAVKFYTGKKLEGAHNSDNDTIASLDVLEGQMFMYDMSIEDLVEYSKQKGEFVDFDRKIKRRESDGVFIWGDFGKNKGRPIKEDLSYCDWFLGADFSSHSKIILRQIITNKII